MRLVSRRRVLAAATSGATLKAARRGDRRATPREEFPDGLTGREVERLTDLGVLHHLPGCQHRFIARSGSFLLLAAEHGGTRQFHRLELKRRRLTQVTEGEAVHPYAACLQRNDRGFYFLQGRDLIQADLNGGSQRAHHRCPAGWVLTGEMDISRGERYAAVVEMLEEHWEPDPRRQFRREPLCRIRIVELGSRGGGGRTWLAAEEGRWLAKPRFRPFRSQLLYAREGPWRQVRRRHQLVALDGSRKASVRPTSGREWVGRAYWTTDGSRLRYVHFPDGDGWKASIRSIQPETRSESTEAPCSAFGWFRENRNGSAIVGASRRPSGPNVYVLFPRMRREITLCEHASTLAPYPVAGSDRVDPCAAAPDPALSANSARLYFVTDREGSPALYEMPLDDLVEATSAG